AISGTWQLLVTDFKNDGNGGNPTQRVDSWSLHFSAYINSTGFSADVSPGAATVSTAATTPYPLVTAASGTPGIGPGLAVAVDNTLGALSPYQGRMYIAYTGGGGSNTDVFLITSDNSGSSWSGAVRVNDDSTNDNFSEGN